MHVSTLGSGMHCSTPPDDHAQVSVWSARGTNNVITQWANTSFCATFQPPLYSPLTDIPFGNRHGMKTLLVFTGHGTREDLESLAAEDDRRPTYFTDTAAVLSCS